MKHKISTNLRDMFEALNQDYTSNIFTLKKSINMRMNTGVIEDYIKDAINSKIKLDLLFFQAIKIYNLPVKKYSVDFDNCELVEVI